MVSGSSIATQFTAGSIPVSLGGLSVDNINTYTVTITDSSLPVSSIITTGLTISGPNPIVLTLSSSLDVACYNGATGELHYASTGGLAPYSSTTTTGPAGYTSNALDMFGLIAGTYVTTIIDALGTPATITTTLNQSAQLVTATASAYDLAKQCDSTQYIIPFYITAGVAPLSLVNVEYLLSPSPTWTTQVFTYNNPATPMYLNIPKASMNSFIKIRFRQASTTVPSVTCYSNALTINKTQIELPTVDLQLINATSIMQCTTGTASITINIIRDALRIPILIEYSKDGGTTWLSAGMASSASHTFNVTGVAPTQTLKVRGTDNKGCETTPITFNVVTPSANLSGSKSISGPTSLIYYTHTISASGGIGVKTSTPYSIGSTTDTTPSNPAITITDSVGCTITI